MNYWVVKLPFWLFFHITSVNQLFLTWSFRYDMMSDCWNEQPSKRPSFSDIISILENYAGKCSISDLLSLNLNKDFFNVTKLTSTSKVFKLFYYSRCGSRIFNYFDCKTWRSWSCVVKMSLTDPIFYMFQFCILSFLWELFTVPLVKAGKNAPNKFSQIYINCKTFSPDSQWCWIPNHINGDKTWI